MEIYKVKNYKVFADQLKDMTGCDVSIKLIAKNHTHFFIPCLWMKKRASKKLVAQG